MKKLYLTLLLALFSANSLFSQNFEVDGIAYNITSAEAPFTVEVIRKTAQYIGAVVIPEQVSYEDLTYSVTGIEERAFYFCYGLTSIAIPKSVTNIGDNAFSSCSGLTSIDVDGSSEHYSTDKGVLYNKERTILIKCPEGKEVDSFVIPISVTTIGKNAFSSCRSIKTIEIPNSVTNIGSDAFYLATGLKSIIVDVTNEHYSSDAGVLYNMDKTSLIRYPQGKIGNSFKIPNSVTNIGYRAFSFCSSLTSIEIPNSVTDIGNWAIYACTGLTSIEIPNSVTNIGLDAFNSCNKITSIEIPNSVTSIGSNAFANCGSLTSVQISNSVTNIGSWAFSNCISLTSINVDIANEYYSSDAGVLYNKDKTVIIKYPVRKEGNVFAIPNSVTNIGKNAFDGCRRLTAIEIPDVVTNIGYHAFSNCSGLTSMTCYAENLPVLGSSVFWDVPKNIPLYVPAGSVALYQQADQWKEFNITALVTTSRRNTTEINSNIDIYPNPVSDLLNIDLGGFHGEVSFEIFNAAGQFILSGQFASTKTINTGSFEPGIYVIRMKGNNWVETKRFLKK